MPIYTVYINRYPADDDLEEFEAESSEKLYELVEQKYPAMVSYAYTCAELNIQGCVDRFGALPEIRKLLGLE